MWRRRDKGGTASVAAVQNQYRGLRIFNQTSISNEKSEHFQKTLASGGKPPFKTMEYIWAFCLFNV